MPMTRRDLLTLFALLAASPQHAWARPRTKYGGRLRLTLPLSSQKLDPHDPTDLGAALLGASIFEPLFGRTSTNAPYPALAARMPELVEGKVHVTLREHMTFSDGSALTSREVRASLLRSQKTQHFSRAIGTVSTRGRHTVILGSKDLSVAARLLSHPGLAIVGPKHTPTTPQGSGALTVTKLGRVMILERNPAAPRGGSYVDEVQLQSADLRQCLRAFEANLSDIGFLGAGLYQTREGARPFALEPTGLVLAVPGKSLQKHARPGVIHDATSRLPGPPLTALGLEGFGRTTSGWSGPALRILVAADEPWLMAIAAEMERAWSTGSRPVEVESVPSTEYRSRRAQGDFDLALQFLRTIGLSEREVSDELFRFENKAAPRSGRALTPPEAARQLSLGLVGELKPRGHFAKEWRVLSAGASFDLANASRRT